MKNNMRKIISWILLVLTVAVLAFGIYFTVACSIACVRISAELAAKELGGIELFRIPYDSLALGVIFTFVGGGILTILTWNIGKTRIMKIIPTSLFCLFLAVTFGCFCYIIS